MSNMFRESLKMMDLSSLCRLERELMSEWHETERKTSDWYELQDMIEDVLDEICCKRFNCSENSY